VVVDEARKNVVLFGGLNDGQAVLTQGRVYRGDPRLFLAVQRCTDADGDKACDGNVLSLDVFFAGVQDADTCEGYQVTFLHKDRTATWSAVGKPVGATFEKGLCRARNAAIPWSRTADLDVGVRVRDLQYTSPSLGTCRSKATDVSSDGAVTACLPSNAYVGTAVCGGLVDPAVSPTKLCDKL
jgi:hypothetical protein